METFSKSTKSAIKRNLNALKEFNHTLFMEGGQCDTDDELVGIQRLMHAERLRKAKRETQEAELIYV